MRDTSTNRIVTARAYAPSDRDACLALFDGNRIPFFTDADRAMFEAFLAGLAVAWGYQVLERDGRVVACGGCTVEADGTRAGFCWGMVDRGLQGTGLGTRLTDLRLRAAAAIPGVTQVRLDTSQLTQGFYARFGFRPVSVTPDGYGPGLDRWDMVLRLDEDNPLRRR
ncbi:GNAT family N-acetyltransferase [Methylobacterium tarhaniae]|uniref:GNAT family N-acetyltransferase n=1 Tax=Methylobacterium tarhaniae TaxID=1187852 RepID=UPI003D00F768